MPEPKPKPNQLLDLICLECGQECNELWRELGPDDDPPRCPGCDYLWDVEVLYPMLRRRREQFAELWRDFGLMLGE